MASPQKKQEGLASDVRGMRLKEEDEDTDMDSGAGADFARPEAFSRVAELRSGASTPSGTRRQSASPAKKANGSQSPAPKPEQETVVGGEVTIKVEDGKPKLSRSTSQKVEKRAPQMFFDHEDKTEEACSTFDKLTECTYANKHLGTTEHALECDCSEEWDSATRSNQACGEDSDCINRATKMECVGDCSCGSGCQNRRFQLKQYANVTVIKTEKKGYGLRANVDLRPNDFIFEYIGEVIGENVFRKRMQQYDEEGIKHFYFMSLTKGEFVDATKRGNLGRFCNHSCNPNCYVDKWVVGDKLRMGVFAERKVLAGEELVFNYNVDRYGADPQPCYCGEPNCTGYIGGKTQTERGTKLSNAIIEALGIEDAEAWDTAVAKKPRKKKAGEDDEEYVNNVEPRGLDEDGVNKVMSSLMQCKEKWIAVKLLTRIQRAEDDRVRNRVVRFHGYRILKTALTTFMDDVNVCIQILDILEKMPRLTRNKIQDSNIEVTIKELVSATTDQDVSARASALLEAWSKLEVAYRIPRVKRDPNAAAPERKLDRLDRRGEERRRSISRSVSPEPIRAPTGPRNAAPNRPTTFFANPRPPRPRPMPTGPLPAGWFEATAANGTKYYYDHKGTTTWQRPTMPAAGPAPPPKVFSDQQVLNDLIKNIVKSKQESAKQPSATATPTETPKRERKEDRWKSYPEEKQKKLYESTIQPHIMHVVGKYKHKLAKDDLKRWAKEFAKQVVSSDFRKQRVEDVYKISDRKAKDLKKSAQVFFDKAVKKKELADEKKAEKKTKQDPGAHANAESTLAEAGQHAADDGDDALSDQEITIDDDDVDVDVTPADSNNSPSSHKRRRDDEDLEQELKKQRTQSVEGGTPPPPPPPPPPAGDEPTDNCAADAAVELQSGDAMAEADLEGATSALALRSTNPAHPRSVTFDLEPMQVATPPTTGSPDRDDLTKTPGDGTTVDGGHP